MDLVVRPALPTDPCVPLLFESARPYYTAYAGSERRALALLEAVFTVPGHAASFDCCTIAMEGETLVGLVAGFPVQHGDSRSRRFVRLTLPKLPPWRWPATFGHLRAAGRVAPSPPADAYYVDALAVADGWRRRGIARRLLDEARIEAERSGLHRLALDTGLHNDSARRLYESYGFGEREIRRAADARTERALGGPGFVGYLMAV
jgi:ribosomal protein S18 acetylase RimI-like enzyme